ncbi:MAG: oxidoreductase [Selenomonadaceae bacterium]|nr:oxidoreductase [Selenomonadaceae bacterium]
MSEAYYITAGELFERGSIPEELQKNAHLIYNSPAALDFNSPGAEGFGVKRAGLAVPGSVMLLVSPACCGRNTSALGQGFGERFAYLLLDENDIVTGKHLTKIPEAANEFVNSREELPTVLMLCITCVDALLGTDMERVARKVEERIGIPCRPCYMYALTRESHRPPMVYVRETVYSLLKPAKKKYDVVNLLGYFSPLNDKAELYEILRKAGVKRVQELSRTKTMEEYHKLSEANFNLVLNPEARAASKFFLNKLNIPSIELTRLYQIDKIRSQYAALARAIDAPIDDAVYYEETLDRVKQFISNHGNEQLAIGSRINGNAFEIALAMARYGLKVKEIFADPELRDFAYLKHLARLSPETKIMSNLSPTMVHYKEDTSVTLALGKDAAYYHPRVPSVYYNEEIQPFGYQGIKGLFSAMESALAKVKK